MVIVLHLRCIAKVTLRAVIVRAVRKVVDFIPQFIDIISFSITPFAQDHTGPPASILNVSNCYNFWRYPNELFAKLCLLGAEQHSSVVQ
jgi:hypothetical protein